MGYLKNERFLKRFKKIIMIITINIKDDQHFFAIELCIMN